MKIAISIIVPVYKVEKYLGQCIKSIISQTFTNWELLLIDDGSPDASGEICDDYALKDSRIRVFHKENGGVSSARNLGLDKAVGEWVTFIDSDDYLLPDFLDGLYMPIRKGVSVEFVHGGCVNSKEGKLIGINQSYEYYVGDRPDIVFNRLRGLTFSKLFRLENVRHRPDGRPLYFDEKMKIAEDMAFTLDYVLYVKRYAFVPETGYCYRIDNMESATKSKRIPDYETELHSFRHLYQSTRSFVEKYDLKEEQVALRLQQLGKHLQHTCLLLYHNKFNKNNRIQHLKKDFSQDDLMLLALCENNIRKIPFSFLQQKFYKTFDCIISVLLKIKKQIIRIKLWL